MALPVGRDLTLHQKMRILSNLGHWPQMEKVIKEHGPDSQQLAGYVDEHMPSKVCEMCGSRFHAFGRRIRYCSDACRRSMSRAAECAGTTVSRRSEIFVPDLVLTLEAKSRVRFVKTRFYKVGVLPPTGIVIFWTEGGFTRSLERQFETEEEARRYGAVKQYKARQRGYVPAPESARGWPDA